MEIDKPEQTPVNDSGTLAASGTRLTHACSRAVLTDPELAAFRSWLNLNQHNHPEPAKTLGYNMVSQIENYLAGDFAPGAFWPLFGYQLGRFEEARR